MCLNFFSALFVFLVVSVVYKRLAHFFGKIYSKTTFFCLSSVDRRCLPLSVQLYTFMYIHCSITYTCTWYICVGTHTNIYTCIPMVRQFAEEKFKRENGEYVQSWWTSSQNLFQWIAFSWDYFRHLASLHDRWLGLLTNNPKPKVQYTTCTNL